ncbi:MAG: hypothetical protein R3C45_08925 [Phycisphaerales bacterium]
MKSRGFLSCSVVTLSFLVCGSGASGAIKNWNAGSGNWSTPTNWTLAGVPALNDTVNIKPSDGVARTINYDIVSPTLTYLTVELTGAGTNRVTFNTNGNNLSLVNGFVIGDVGRATFNQTGGSVSYSNVNLDAIVGFNAGGDGIYNLSGGNLSVARGLYVGTFGSSTGLFNQTGGAVTAGGSLVLGSVAGSNGTYNISNNASVTATDIYVGNQGTGTLSIHDNASVSANSSFYINGSGTLNMDGGTLRLAGYTRTGTFNYTAGTIRLVGDRVFGADVAIPDIFGTTPTITPGKTLSIEGGADVRTTVNVAGGNLNILSPTNLFRIGFSQSGTLNINSGGTVVSNTNTFLGVLQNFSGALNVDGPGSSFTVNGQLYVGYEGNGTLNVTNGATVTATSTAYIAYDPTAPNTATGTALVSGPDSMLHVGYLNVGSGAASGTLTIEDGATVYSDSGFYIQNSSAVNLNGGTLRFDSYTAPAPGTTPVFNFNAGTIQLAGNRSIGSDSAIQRIFGAAPTLVSGKGLTVEGTATLLTTTTVNGGTFTTNGLVNGHNLKLQHGTFNLQDQALVIGGGQLLGDTLDLASDMTVNVALGTANAGLVTGDGQVGGTFTNAAGGELRAEPGKSLRFTGANNANLGQVNLFGGLLEFTQDLTNFSTGFISGNGTLMTQTGLLNEGTMNFSGSANIVGDVNIAAGGRVISSGGGPTTFFDDVVNNGQIRTSAGSSTVFFGSLSGVGSFTGTGTVNMEGDLKPGNSPAIVSFGGNVAMGPFATLFIELGGLTAGSQYDRLDVTGVATLDGILDVSLINGFTPGLGDSYTLLMANGGIAGGFSGLSLPDLSGLGLDWDLSISGSTVLLEVVNGSALVGDLNGDGFVGIADLNLVLSNWNQTVPPANPLADPSGDGFVGIADLNAVLGNWNAGTPPSGSAAIPEPAAGSMITLLVACLTVTRRSGSRFMTVDSGL